MNSTKIDIIGVKVQPGASCDRLVRSVKWTESEKVCFHLKDNKKLF